MSPTYSIRIKTHQLISYFKFLLKSGNAHGLHSPFVFEIYTKAIKSGLFNEEFKEIEKQRSHFLQNRTEIELNDLGAGSHRLKSNRRKISDIAKTSLSPKFKCELLFRIVNHLESGYILELGTNLGISTRYISIPETVEKCLSIEGDEGLSEIAKKHQKTNVEIWNSRFEEAIKKLKGTGKKFDFIFVDGDHKLESTLNNVEKLKALLKENGVIVLDDIYWSQEMTQAWNQLKRDECFGISIDLFHLGLIFNRHKQPKQEFTLRV